MMSRNRIRHDFTLVEMLVVIVIITTLAAIIVPAVYIAIQRAKQARIVLEVANVARALERYKLEYGEYPPDFSSAAILSGTARQTEARRLISEHLSTVFRRRSPFDLPRELNDKQTVDEAVLEQLDPSNALVFWLQGFSPNPQFPIAGEGERSPLMDFDKGRFVNEIASGALNADPNAPQATPRLFAAGYYPDGDSEKRPYLYYSADSYTSRVPITDPNQIPAVAWANSVGVTPPYLSSTLPGNFAEPEKFQLISAGLDSDYGAIPAADQSDFARYPIVPSGTNIDKPHRDNISNFSGGTISDMLE